MVGSDSRATTYPCSLRSAIASYTRGLLRVRPGPVFSIVTSSGPDRVILASHWFSRPVVLVRIFCSFALFCVPCGTTFAMVLLVLSRPLYHHKIVIVRYTLHPSRWSDPFVGDLPARGSSFLAFPQCRYFVHEYGLSALIHTGARSSIICIVITIK